MPQFSLAYGVVSQNLLPGMFGSEGAITQAGGENGNYLSMAIVSGSLLVICTAITWSYDRGGWGIKMYERLLKILVALIVLCFFGVVGVLTAQGVIDWGAVSRGIIPDFGQFWRPAASFTPLLEQLDESSREYWSKLIVSKQQDVLFSAAATAVGINMTFLFLYPTTSFTLRQSFLVISSVKFENVLADLDVLVSDIHGTIYSICCEIS